MNNKNLSQWNNEMYRKFPTRRGVYHFNPIVRFIEENRMRHVLSFLPDLKDKKVLELGCEEGILISRINGSYRELVGIDISSEAIKQARKLHQGIKFVVADATKRTPFKNSHFDVIICSETMEHVPEHGKMVKEMARLLRAGGILSFSVPYEKSLTNTKRVFKKLRLFNMLFGELESDTSEWHTNFFDKKQIRESLSPYFDIQKIMYTPFPFIGPKLVVRAKRKD